MRLTVAHSPDADDLFMAFGLAQGAVDQRGLEIELVAADIDQLNQNARDGGLDVSAISFAAWPQLADVLDLLPVGSSFGLGYGPRLVAREPRDLAELAGCVVAVPGDTTTAAIVLRLAVPGVRTRVVPFDQVAAVVAAGEADAGVVIHEGQLTYERDGLVRLLELGEWWAEQTDGLPLPLGANAIRRALPADVKSAFARVMADSIRHALAHRDEAVAASLSPDRGLDLAGGDRYVAMYVNELTLDPGERGRRAVDELYRRGAEAGLLPRASARWVE